MDEAIYDLDAVAGDTSFRYSQLYTTGLVTIPVRIRITSTSSYIKVFYLKKYI